MDLLSMTGSVLFAAAVGTIKDLVVAAVKAGANLRGANLSGAYLCGANLSGAYLCGANLRGANLSGANLSGANLSGAYLSGAHLSNANLSGANLSGAYLSGAHLSNANLSNANLSGANLSGAYLSNSNLSNANLSGANLCGANLSGAYLSGAYLCGAYLCGAKDAEWALSLIQFIPEEGNFIGWKKCKSGVIVKLQIPDGAKRSHATGRKCRAEKVLVLEVFNGEFGLSGHDGKTEYHKGTEVLPDSFDDNRWEECSNGIHFFLTRIEAEKYQL